MEKLNEDYKILDELLRTAYELISPLSFHDDLDRLTPDFVSDDSKKRPGCYLKLGQGANHTLFPICNRYGYKDPRMMKYSLELARKLDEENEDVDVSDTIIELKRLLNKYDRPIPNTVSQANLKRKSTKMFNKQMNISKDGQIKATKKLNEYENFVVDESKMTDFLKGGLIGDLNGQVKQQKMKARRIEQGAGAIAITSLLYGLKKLYDHYKKEKDPRRKAEIKNKIQIEKSKIAKAKEKSRLKSNLKRVVK